jgi:hypothetical protein
VFANAGGTTRVYAIHNTGTASPSGPFLTGWPIAVAAAARRDSCRSWRPGHMLAAADLDLDPATTELVDQRDVGNTQIVRVRRHHDPHDVAGMTAGRCPSDSVDQSAMIDLLSYPAIAGLRRRHGPRHHQRHGLGRRRRPICCSSARTCRSTTWSARGTPTRCKPLRIPKATDDFVLLSHPVVADVGKPGVAGAPSDGRERDRRRHRDVPAARLQPGRRRARGLAEAHRRLARAAAALGDVDGDGLLEVAANTREGNVYVWDTDGSACANNAEWWTYHHDEWNTGDYRRDTRAPDRVASLAATSPALLTVDATWSAPGDDGPCGQATSYEMAWSSRTSSRPRPSHRANPVALSAPPAAGHPR